MGAVLPVPPSAQLIPYRNLNAGPELWPRTLALISHGLTGNGRNALKLCWINWSFERKNQTPSLAEPRGEKPGLVFSVCRVRGRVWKFLWSTLPPKQLFPVKSKLFSDSSFWGDSFGISVPNSPKLLQKHLLSQKLSLNSPFVRTATFHKTHFRGTWSCHIPGSQLSVTIWKSWIREMRKVQAPWGGTSKALGFLIFFFFLLPQQSQTSQRITA